VTDSSKSAEELALASEQLEASIAKIGDNENEIAQLSAVQEAERAELDYQKHRFEQAQDSLQDAADVRAAADLAAETTEYNALKVTRDTLKA
jgi:hypothetical protein